MQSSATLVDCLGPAAVLGTHQLFPHQRVATPQRATVAAHPDVTSSASTTTGLLEAQGSFSLTRTPPALKRLGVSSSFTPGQAALESRGANTIQRHKSWKASSLMQSTSKLPTSNEGLIPSAANTHSSSVLTDVQRATEERAQQFYLRMEAAAERELAFAQVKTPTIHGIPVDRAHNALQYGRVGLKAPGAATKRLATMNGYLYDKMIQEALPGTAQLRDVHRLFGNPVNATHVAMYASTASPAQALASGYGALSTSHVNPGEYNPYFPRTTSHIGRTPTPGPMQPLVIAVPDDEACAVSPIKGAVGTLVLSSPRSSWRPPNTRINYAQPEQSSIVPYIESVGDNSSEPDLLTTHAPQPSSTAERVHVLTDDDKAVLFHACGYAANINGQRTKIFSSAWEFQKAIGVPEAAARAMLQQMARHHDSWEMLADQSVELRIVVALLNALLGNTSNWQLPNIRLPSGGSTSKLRVQALHQLLTSRPS